MLNLLLGVTFYVLLFSLLLLCDEPSYVLFIVGRDILFVGPVLPSRSIIDGLCYYSLI